MKFDVKDMGELHFFVGVKIIQDQEAESMWIGQPAYTENILQKFGMESAKPVGTPVDTGTKFVKTTEECEAVDSTLYQSAVHGKLVVPVDGNKA